jgi:histidyl-tRNA synthetase
MRVNNRKICEGFYRGIGLTEVAAVLRTVDKLDKIGPDAVLGLLTSECGASDDQARQCLSLAEIQGDDSSVVASVRSLGVADPLLDEGLAELAELLDAVTAQTPGILLADLSVARGLDYYTGTVFETHLVGHEDLGSICSGGRYDELARDGERTFPGVGISFGVSRLVGGLLGRRLVEASRSVPTCVLVALPSDDARADCDRIATRLRSRGIPVETAPVATKYGKQIRFAERRGIPYVWFPGADGQPDEVKDIRSGDQVPADLDAWLPPDEDLHPRILALHAEPADEGAAP